MRQGDKEEKSGAPADARKGLTSGTEVNQSIASRLRALRGDRRPVEFARASGVREGLMRKYLAGSIPGADKLAQIARANDVTVDWLATGEGPKERDSLSAPQLRAGYSYMPLLDVRAAGGKSAAVETEGARASAVETEGSVDVLAFKDDWIRHELRATPNNLRLIYVEGDGMEPELRAGDIVLIDQTDKTARREGIYVLKIDDTLLVKMLQRLPGGLIKVTSRNESYEPFSLKADELEASPEIAIVGRVIWGCRRY